MQISPSAIIPGCLSHSHQLPLGRLQAGLSHHQAPLNMAGGGSASPMSLLDSSLSTTFLGNWAFFLSRCLTSHDLKTQALPPEEIASTMISPFRLAFLKHSALLVHD